MNPSVILALISTMYEQLLQANARIEVLEAQMKETESSNAD